MREQRAVHIIDKIDELIKVAKFNLHNGGIFLFLNKSFSFLRKFLLSYEVVYIYEKQLNGKLVEFFPKIENVTLEIIKNVDQYRTLIKNGYDFGSIVNENWIKEGTIPFCVFVNKELGHVTWVALDGKAKNYVDELPYEVDFFNSAATSGGSKTNPKYARKGLYLFAYSNIFKFLKENNKKKDIFAINKDNTISQNALAKFDPRKIHEISYINFCWWRYIIKDK